MISEAELEQRVVSVVQKIKATYSNWEDPTSLAHSLGIRIVHGRLGQGREGAALDDLIVVDPAMGGPGRAMFTFYHEITHRLIRMEDELYSILHDQYDDPSDFTMIVERLANAGAAEFLIPRAVVMESGALVGFNLSLMITLLQSSPASRTAVLVQVGLCAPHRCLAVVAKHAEYPSNPDQINFLSATSSGFAVELSVSSRSMKYAIARRSPVPPHHFLRGALNCEEGVIIQGKDRIPFRSSTRNWVVMCEAVRFGSQVFGLFHVDPPPTPAVNQLRFDI